MIASYKTCGTSYEVADAHPEHCDICLDGRQYVPTSGQKWIDFDTLCVSHTNKWKQHDSTLLGIRTVSDFAIDQRAFLVRTPEGNILWDCVATLDDATKTLITFLGGLEAIAISHPYYYTTMQDWAAEFGAPIYLHVSDRRWAMRDSPWIRFWDGDTTGLTRDVKAMRLGRHFAGGCVLHWACDEGVVLSGDIVQVTPGAHAVSFMWSYPNMLPLPAATVSDIIRRLRMAKFKQLYDALEGKSITQNTDEIVRRSGEKYISYLK